MGGAQVERNVARMTPEPLAAASGTGLVAALTFDDGPNPGETERLLDDLLTTLAIIREALGDPAAPVPFFRAPNGNWGVSAHVAATLGMQPLGLGNTIADWRDEWQDEVVLAANLRAAIRPGAAVLVHDGGGERSASVAAVASVLPEYLAAGWRFTLPVIGG